jgi:uncharacterized membrane protein/YHS domain-containing protein
LGFGNLTSSWLQVLGRLHPLVLHLPIGLIVGLAIFEFASMFRPSRPRSTTIVPLAWLCAAFAIFSAVSGYVLADRDGYDTDAVTPHLILGIFTAIGAVATAFTYSLSSRMAAPRAALLVTFVLLIVTGHLGASLTHGPDFLTGPLARAIKGEPPEQLASNTPRQRPAPPPANTPNSVIPAVTEAGAPSASAAPDFATVIQPLLTARCVSCHDDTNRKGGLSLASADAILAGSDAGPVVEPGDAANSELLIRLRLPLDIRGHMPPRMKAQPSAEDINAIEAWITAGAPFPGSNTALNAPIPLARPPVRAHNAGVTAPPAPAPAPLPTPATAPPLAPPTPDPAAIARLRDKLAHVAPISAADPLLSINFNAPSASIDDATATQLLTPLVGSIGDLSLARTKAARATLALARTMPRLQRLDLRATPITAADLKALEGHPSLAELVLAQTMLTDDAADVLASLPALRRVYVWHSGLSDAAIAALRSRKPDLSIDAGDTLTTPALEQEPDIALSSEAPPPGTPAAPPADLATLLKPINTTCPVSGAPVDPKYSVLYEGRVIGFCCPNCPKEFWADPQKFLAKLPK